MFGLLKEDKYPLCIVPRPCFSQTIDLRKLLDVYPCLEVSRRIDGDPRELVKVVGGVKVLLDSAFKERVARLSVNLSGGKYVARKHIRFKPTDKSIIRDWDGITIVSDFAGKFNVISPCFPVFYRVRDFLDFPLKQEMTFTKQKDFDGYVAKVPMNKRDNDYLKQFISGRKIALDVNKSADHRPTFCNYWHVELSVFAYEDDNNPIEMDDSNGVHQRILKHLKIDYLTKQVSLKSRTIPVFSCFYNSSRGCQKLSAVVRKLSFCFQSLVHLPVKKKSVSK